MQNAQGTISIVIPTIGRKQLDETIESIFAQSTPPDEFIIFDNSGTGAAANLSKYAGDSRITWKISPVKNNIIDSWNTATSSASSEYIYLCGDDDILYNDFISSFKSRQKKDISLFFCNFDLIDENSSLLQKGDFIQNDEDIDGTGFAVMLGEQRIPYRLGTLIFKREIFYQIGKFKNLVMRALDMDLLFHIECAFASERTALIKTPIWAYRTATADWSGAVKDEKERQILIDEWVKFIELIRSLFNEHGTPLSKRGPMIMLQNIITQSAKGRNSISGLMRNIYDFCIKNSFEFRSRKECLRDCIYAWRNNGRKIIYGAKRKD
jgi:glycosyltransferase involved in cell wall biosynthesis